MQTVAEWADAERRLSPESSAEPGQWRTSRAEYQRGFMSAFSDPAIHEIVGVWASQVGKTDALLNIIGQRMATQPGPMLMIQPTLGMAEAWSKDRLAPMLRDTPALRGLVREARSRDSGNTVLHKQFPGGHLTMAGANSPASLASRPIRDVFFDEVDRYPPSAGTEGDPVKLAATRTRAFWNAKKVYISSPGVRGASRIEGIWRRSDQRFYYVPCPDCHALQVLKWAQVHWEKDSDGDHRPETAVYVCEHCGSCWDDHQRRQAVAAGEWRATREFRGCAGFHVSALAAPWESCRLEALVVQWLEAQGNPDLLKVFANTVLAEWWEDVYEALDDTGLMRRREPLEVDADGRAVIPSACALVTAGVDVQENRVEVTVDAWAAGEECWRLAHTILWGDPTSVSLWDDLDAYLLAPWQRADGGGLEWIRGVAVDTGGSSTQAAYDYCGPRFRRATPDGGRQFVFAVKGMAGAGELWPRAASRATSKVPLWPIRVDVAKEQIYGRLGIAAPGPGYVHFPPWLDRTYFVGLTAEKLVSRTDRKGFVRRTWEKRHPSARNEPLDCAVYSYAALCGLRANGFDLDLEVARLGARPVYQPGVAPPPKVARPAPSAPVRTPGRRPVRAGWLGDTSGWLG